MKRLLLFGSPCTKWSVAQNPANRELTCEGEGWEWFRNCVIAKELFKPDFYLYENNVSASALIKQAIEENLGDRRVEVNSALVSPQNRNRFYVSNLNDMYTPPQDRGLLVKDIIDFNYHEPKEYDILYPNENPKKSKTGTIRLGLIGKANSQGNRVYSVDGKGVTLTANGGGLGAKTGLYFVNGKARKLSYLEAMRMQTVPEWYQWGDTSNTQRLKMLGNGWTCDIIKSFLQLLPKDEECEVLSLYDGMSCGQIVLKELGLNVKTYISVEIDKYCQDVIRLNFPNSEIYNDCFDVRNENSDLYRRIIR